MKTFNFKIRVIFHNNYIVVSGSFNELIEYEVITDLTDANFLKGLDSLVRIAKESSKGFCPKTRNLTIQSVNSESLVDASKFSAIAIILKNQLKGTYGFIEIQH